MTKDGALPKGFERPSSSPSQEKYEKVKPSSKTTTLRISKFNPKSDSTSTFSEFKVHYEMDYCTGCYFRSQATDGSFNRCTLFM